MQDTKAHHPLSNTWYNFKNTVIADKPHNNNCVQISNSIGYYLVQDIKVKLYYKKAAVLLWNYRITLTTRCHFSQILLLKWLTLQVHVSSHDRSYLNTERLYCQCVFAVYSPDLALIWLSLRVHPRTPPIHWVKMLLTKHEANKIPYKQPKYWHQLHIL